MPVDIIRSMIQDGPEVVPGWHYLKNYGPIILGLSGVKYMFSGSTNTWDRDLHGKVFIVTGGTSGIGSALVRDLAYRGAQLILLTSQIDEVKGGTVWLEDYIEDLRDQSGNLLIFSEACDLSSLYSIRKFATKWLDNSPPRRLDGVICLAGESVPMGKNKSITVDGIERQMAINYLGHFHLLTMMEPSLKVQPPDRDVRVLISSCTSQSVGEIDVDDLLWENKKYPKNSPWKVYGTSKLMLNMFAKEYQRRLTSFTRGDGAPCNVRINIVNPGFVRSPSTRRVLSMGSIIGLFVYLLFYPIWWLFLKSCEQGMQSYLYCLFCPKFIDIDGGNYIKECSIIEKESRRELLDSELQKEVFDATKTAIDRLERSSAIERNKQKGANTKKEKAKAKDAKKQTPAEKAKAEAATKEEKIFKSAFQDTTKNNNDLFPDLKKIQDLGDDEFRNERLKSLDEKYFKSRGMTGNEDTVSSGVQVPSTPSKVVPVIEEIKEEVEEEDVIIASNTPVTKRTRSRKT